MTVIYEPAPRYIVETADTISNAVGEPPFVGRWSFAYAFAKHDDAVAMADRLAEDHEFVRVIDRNPTTTTKENN